MRKIKQLPERQFEIDDTVRIIEKGDATGEIGTIDGYAWMGPLVGWEYFVKVHGSCNKWCREREMEKIKEG